MNGASGSETIEGRYGCRVKEGWCVRTVVALDGKEIVKEVKEEKQRVDGVTKTRILKHSSPSTPQF